MGESLARPSANAAAVPAIAAHRFQITPKPRRIGQNLHISGRNRGTRFARGLAVDVACVGHPKATGLSFLSVLVALQLGFLWVELGQCFQAYIEYLGANATKPCSDGWSSYFWSGLKHGWCCWRRGGLGYFSPSVICFSICL